MTYDRFREILDPRFPGEWLAAVGLSCFGSGRWRRYEDGLSGWFYEHDSDLPETWRLQAILDDLGPAPEDPVWLCFSGQGLNNRASAGRRLSGALEGVDINDLRLRRWDRPHTDVASSWMIDETWRRQPGMGLSHDHPTPVPVIEASLALIATYSEILPTVSTWVSRRVAVGWLWDTSIKSTLDENWEILRPKPPLDATVMTWRRQPRKGEPHTGALGAGTELKLTLPTWDRWVPIELQGPPRLGEAAAAYLAREPEVGDPVGVKEAAAMASMTQKDLSALIKRGEFPPARWLVDGKPAWSASADVTPWIELYQKDDT